MFSVTAIVNDCPLDETHVVLKFFGWFEGEGFWGLGV